MAMRPIILGIVGDSASGKTTISAGIARIIGEERVTVICTDNYHRYDRKQRKDLNISALNPDCNYINIMEQHLEMLRRGDSILCPVYNHSTGEFDPPVYVTPGDFVVIEGLLGFHTHALRDQYDVKVYLDPPEDVRIQWKLKRDTTKRGYSEEQVRASLEKRRGVSERFIHPQKREADIVVQFYPDDEIQKDSQLKVRLHLRSTLAHPDLTEVVGDQAEGTNGKPTIKLEVGRHQDRLTELLDVSHNVESDLAMRIEEILCGYLPELCSLPYDELGGFLDGATRRHSDTLAIAQMLIVYHLLGAERELRRRSEELSRFR